VKILIVGASGNLGSLLSKRLFPGPHPLRLLIHRQPLPFTISRGAKLETAAAIFHARTALAKDVLHMAMPSGWPIPVR